jgi:hypothetical protein
VRRRSSVFRMSTRVRGLLQSTIAADGRRGLRVRARPW